MHPGGEPIADQLARQLSLPEVRLQPELLAEAERRLERERSARRVTLQTLLETAQEEMSEHNPRQSSYKVWQTARWTLKIPSSR